MTVFFESPSMSVFFNRGFYVPERYCFFLRARVCRVFLGAEYTQPEVGSGEQNLKKLPQMPASGFLNHSERNWPNPGRSFYLPVSMSRTATVVLNKRFTL